MRPRVYLTRLSSLHHCSAPVKEFAAAFVALNLPLHLLVNNAGIAFTDYATTKQGLEQQWGCDAA